MGLLDLNHDVLTAIVAHLDSASARKLSYTARGIHLIATYRSLQSVTLCSLESVIAFLKYMLGDMSHRISALQKLELRCDIPCHSELRMKDLDSSEELLELLNKVASQLTDLFYAAVSLRVLVMDSAEAWMTYETQMMTALCSLGALREIELGRVGEHISELINNSSSAPRKLIIRDGPPFGAHEKLVLGDHVRLRSVTMLVADNPGCLLPSPKELARAFPNAVALDFTRAIDVGPWRHSVRGPIAVNWPSVERLCGSLSSFESWATITPVHSLELVDRLSCSDSAPPHAAHGARPMPTSARRITRACSAANTVIANFQPAVLVVELNVSIKVAELGRLVKNSTRLRYLAILIDDSHRQAGIGSWWVSDVSCAGRQCERQATHTVHISSMDSVRPSPKAVSYALNCESYAAPPAGLYNLSTNPRNCSTMRL